MDGLWFVAAFIGCILVGAGIVKVLERRYDAREPDLHEVDVYLPVWVKPKVYDWNERGDFDDAYGDRMERFYNNWEGYP